MKIPIGNALFNDFNYSKFFTKKNKKGNSIHNLEFYPVNKKKFPVVKLIPTMNSRKSAPIIINAANEIFVDQFLQNNIHFNHISTYLNLIVKNRNYIKTSNTPSNSIKNIYKIDNWARNTALQIIKKNK